MNICIFGAGYVGLSLAVMLASKKTNFVTLIDIDKRKINLIRNRISPIKDSFIDNYLQNKELNLSCTEFNISSIKDADIVFIATPTNYNEKANCFDVNSVESVIQLVLSNCKENTQIVIKSTLPVGFTNQARKKFKSKRIHFSPEFLREGTALYDSLYPSRIIIGTDNLEFGNEYLNLLSSASEEDSKKINSMIVSPTEAESIKLFANTYLAMRISFFNELDTYAYLKGLNTKAIIEGVCLDTRIGSFYNNPSFGYGGYCLPKDTKQLLADYKGIPNKIIRAIVKSNSTRMDFITSLIIKKSPKIVGIYRLVMKSGSDNFRSSSIQGIISRLKKHEAKIVIYEPNYKEKTFLECKVINEFSIFKDICDTIIANRWSEQLEDVKDKCITRDIFHNN